MIGSLLAGTDESPGETFSTRAARSKTYRGMGSTGAMQQGSYDRYRRTRIPNWCPRASKDAWRPGPLSEMVYQLVGGLRSGMGYCGARDMASCNGSRASCGSSSAGLRESHVHDVIITKEAPNYRVE